ncbi:hypothetical protein GCM10022221_49400 [Actinocorallia aurea]
MKLLGGIPLGDDVYAWGAGEAGVMRALRRHLRNDRGIPAGRIAVRGYWRLGGVGAPPRDED